jgi:integrase
MGRERTDGTVAEHTERWLAVQGRSAKKASTIKNYEWAVHQWLLPTLGDIPIGELTVDDVESVLFAMQDAGLAKNSMVRVRSVLSQVLDRAVRRRAVDRNVATLAVIPAGTRRQGRSLTLEQATKLLQEAERSRLGALVVTGLLLGLRPGELAGLRWSDVDLGRGILSVEHARVETPDGPVIGDPKEEWTRRKLNMPAAVITALRRHRRRQDFEKAAAGPAWHDFDLVFPTSVGTPFDRWGLRRRLQTITRAAGLGEWQPKELRHSFVSLLSDAGVPIEVIADLVGHRNARITAEVYRHRIRRTVGAAKPVMDAIFPDANAAPPEAS